MPALLPAALAHARHEWRQLAYAPLSYVFQGGFLLALMAAVFLVADFFTTDSATMDLMLVFLPWIAAVFVPALAMHAYRGSAHGTELELALSLPTPTGAMVAGKWLAGSAFLLLTLALTFPFPLTLAYLGEPDWGVVAAGYLAAALLLVSFLAVAHLAAALAREPVAVLILATLMLVVLMVLGWDATARTLAPVGGSALIDLVALGSPLHWFGRIAGGLVEPAALVYFAVLSALPLLGANAVITARRARATPMRGLRHAIAAGLACGLGLAAVVAARAVPVAWDLTAEREFTLHAGTLAVIAETPDDVTIDLYWSAGEADVPMAIRSHAGRVQDLLAAVAARSEGRIVLRTHDPQPDSEAEFDALAAGITRVPLSSGRSFMLGATFTHGARQGRISYFDMRREGLLEHDVAFALRALGRPETPRVGLLSPLVGPRDLDRAEGRLSFLHELASGYDVAILSHLAEGLSDDLDVLVVLQAPVLRREMLYAIDQHVMAGGGLVVLMDPFVRMDAASNQIPGAPTEGAVNTIADLLLAWGVRYRADEIVGDPALAAPVIEEGEGELAYPFWLRVDGRGLSRSRPVSADLTELLFVEAGSFVIEDEAAATPLVTTTPGAGGVPRDAFRSGEPRRAAAALEPDGGARIVAVELQGTLASAFAEPPEGIDPATHRPVAEGPVPVFAVADVDWLFDPFAYQTVEGGGGAALRPLNDNVAFLMNMVEYASGDAATISIRSRGRLHRPFTRLSEMLSAARQAYREEEAALVERIGHVEALLARIPEAAGVTRFEDLPPDVRERIRALELRLLEERRHLREIRRGMREDIERLGRQLAAINLAAGPVLSLVVAGGLAFMRRRRRLLLPAPAA